MRCIVRGSMFVATVDRSFRAGRFRATFLIERDCFVSIVRRNGLIYDTRFVPGRSESSSTLVLYLVLAGALELLAADGSVRESPNAVLMSEDQFEGSHGRAPLPLRNHGDPLLAVELRFSAEELAFDVDALPRTLPLPDAVWQAAEHLADQTQCRGPLEGPLRSLLVALADAGMTTPRLAERVTAEDERWRRVWRAARPMAEAFDLLASLDSLALAAGLSLRQTTRDVAGFARSMRVPFGNWRESTRRLRLKVAILGLSVEDLPIAEVATLAGYGSTEAMARAFRDAKQPAPVRVRELLLGPRG